MRTVGMMIACALSFFAQGAEVLLSFQAPRIRLNDDTATLASVLTIRTSDCELKQQIRQIRLLRQDDTLRAESVIQQVGEHVGNDVALDWRGATAVSLRWQKRIDAQTVKQRIRGNVKLWVQQRFGADAHFMWSAEPESLVIDRQSELLSFEIDDYRSDATRLAGFFNIKSANGTEKYAHRYPIAVTKPAWVATCSFAEGERLSRKCFTLQSLKIRQIDYVSAEEDLQQFRVLTSLSPGSVLLSNMVSRIRLIENGSKVNAIYAGRSVMIEVPAIARQAGNPGDKIKIFIPAIETELKAVVTEKGNVVIDES